MSSGKVPAKVNDCELKTRDNWITKINWLLPICLSNNLKKACLQEAVNKQNTLHVTLVLCYLNTNHLASFSFYDVLFTIFILRDPPFTEDTIARTFFPDNFFLN